MSARSLTFIPRILPSLVAASSIYWTCPRPWVVARWFSERSSTHFTGAPSLRATSSASTSSEYPFSLEPNPPAHVRRHDPQLGIRHPAHHGEHVLDEVGNLGRGVYGKAIQRLGLCDDGPCLDGAGDEALLYIAVPDYD